MVFKKGHIPFFKGKSLPEEVKLKISFTKNIITMIRNYQYMIKESES